MIKIKRIYESYEAEDGFRILVDRLWPRGISKEEAKLNLWMKNVAPSTDLRKWFSHDADKWEEFKKRYKKELSENNELNVLKEIIKSHSKVTLLFGAKDEKYNQAIALKNLLDEQI